MGSSTVVQVAPMLHVQTISDYKNKLCLLHFFVISVELPSVHLAKRPCICHRLGCDITHLSLIKYVY